jgi:hypothetical protein
VGAGTTAGPLEHVALVHRGPEELAELVVDDLVAAVDRGEAVLASLPLASWRPLEARLGAAATGVRWLEASDRYATPAGAMTALCRFTADALDAGAPAVWSLGTLHFDGSAADAAWVRYEHAVNAVLADLPLRAVCTFDLDHTPANALRCAAAAHDRVEGGAIDGHADGHVPPLAPVPPPEAPPLVDVEVVTAVAARTAITDALAGSVPNETEHDLRLVVSELATNALRHGRAPARLLVWRAAGSVVVQVRDDGPGIADPFADLRPPRPGSTGGRGLNICAQVARLHFAVGHPSTVTAAVDLA